MKPSDVQMLFGEKLKNLLRLT